MRSPSRMRDRLRFWAGRAGALGCGTAFCRRTRRMPARPAVAGSPSRACAAWPTRLVDGSCLTAICPSATRRRAFLAVFAALRTPDALAHSALARKIAGSLLPFAACPLEPRLIHCGRLRCLGSRRLPLPQGFLKGISCRGRVWRWGTSRRLSPGSAARAGGAQRRVRSKEGGSSSISVRLASSTCQKTSGSALRKRRLTKTSGTFWMRALKASTLSL